MEQITSKLSAFAASARLEDIPTRVRLQAKRTLLNFFGCACGGARHEAVEAVILGRGRWSGRPTTVVIGRQERFDPALAALLNGMSSAVYSFDDTHAEALVHPGGPVACSLLSGAQISTVSGGEFLLAFILGAELVCRLSKSISVLPAEARPEWVQTGVCAGIGGAFASAKLLGLRERAIASAIGIAASRAAGFRGLSRSMCFSYMAGSAAESGLCSALLAQAGMTGPEEPLSSEQGFCSAFSRKPHFAFLARALGENYELSANTFKPYPCGVVIHPAIDASLALCERIPDWRELEQIIIEVHPSSAKLGDCPHPADQFEAQVSLQHWTACAFLDHVAGVEQTKPARLNAPEVVALRSLIRLKENSDMSRSAATVRAILRSGGAYEESAQDCKGSSLRPLSDDEIEAKFMAQAIPQIGENAARKLAEACWGVEGLSDASALLEFATGA